MICKKSLVASALTAFTWHAALAAEGATYGGPIGGTDIRNAYISPVPGFYAGFADVPGVFTQLNGANGGKIPNARFNLVTNTNVLGVAYVYPFQLLGGRIQTDAQFGYLDYARFSAFNRTTRISGWTDSYWDLLKWGKYLGTAAAPGPGRAPLPYGLAIGTAYSMSFPIGQYQPQKPLRPGSNDFFIMPSVIATYLTQPNIIGDGVELDGRLFYNHALENDYNHYRTGDIINLDYAVAERNGRWTFGLAGYVATQIGRDTESGFTVPVRGKYFVAAKLGPIVAYDIPQLGIQFKLKLGEPLYIKNTVSGPSGVLSVGFKLP
ncbi:SphA family protein [Lichenicoccus sp.]|uniref:SphA family protein n=1 Tax=Lichenicoccus sp. TaxID=2781899 RepID=UPI003D135136